MSYFQKIYTNKYKKINGENYLDHDQLFIDLKGYHQDIMRKFKIKFNEPIVIILDQHKTLFKIPVN